MADDLFRARVEPQRAPAPTEDWPEEWDQPAEEVLGDLMASFDQHRVELDERLASATAERPETEEHTATAEPELEPKPGPGPEPTRDPGTATAPNPAAPNPSEAPPPSPVKAVQSAEPHAEPPAEPVAALPADPVDAPSPDPVATASPPPRRSRRTRLIAGAALLVAAGTGAVVTAVAASSSSGSSSPAATPSGPAASSTAAPSTAAPAADPGSTPSPAPTTDPAVAAQAAGWIAENVGPGHVVACDVTVCAMLRGHGFPAAALVTVQSPAQVEQTDIVAVTDVIRQQLGPSLAGVIAGEPMAVFTAGSSTIEVTPVALDGPAAYAARVASDRQARQAAGAALLHNPRITVSPAARAALSGGLVDSRVCTLLAVLGGSHTLTVASFTATGPGAGPDVPLPGVVISQIDGTSAAADSAHTTSLKSVVAAQHPPYAPLSVTRVASGPHQGLAILFAQPSPTGLLGAAKS